MRSRQQLLELERDIDRRPHLRVVRDSAPPPPLELPQAEARGRWVDSPAVGWAIVLSMLAGVVLIALGMGWIR